MKYLITGGAGFIGSHLAAKLGTRGEVRILDNLRTGRRTNLAGQTVELIEGSILDRARVKEAVQGVDCVFHLAAMVSVVESVQRPHECVELNVLGLLNVLEEAAAAGVRKICFSSSAAVYGDSSAPVKTESARPEPQSPYAVTKLDGEYYCRQYAEAGRIEAVALRYFNVFGPRQDPRSAYASAVPIFMQRALANEPITIFGDGLQTRDFIHVDDIVAANVFAATKQGLGGVFNVGGGSEMTVQALAKMIIRLAGSRSELRFAAPRVGEVRHSRADTSALSAGGFSPGVTLEAGLAATLEYYRASH